MISTTETSSDDFLLEFSLVEEKLWQAARSVWPTYERGLYDGWVLCPRKHASSHLRCIIDLATGCIIDLATATDAREVFARLNRFHPGEDLVFAVGDVQ